MRVDVFGSEPQEVVNKWVRKFVLAKDGEEDVLTLSVPGKPEKHQHKDLLVEGRVLVGAGDVYTDKEEDSEYEGGYEIEWGSYSCETRYGYDRPSDEAEADRVLRKIRDRIAQWDEEMSH